VIAIESAGVGVVNRFDLEAGSDAEIDPFLLQVLRMKLIDGKDSFILESVFSMTSFSTMSAPFSKVNEMRVSSFLEDVCEKELAKLDVVSDDTKDAALAKDLTSASPEVTMAKLRLQERAALKGTLAQVRSLKKILESADTSEYYQERRLRELDLLRPLDPSEVADEF